MHGSLTFFLFHFVNKSVQSLPNTLYFGILVHLKEYSDSKKCEILLLLLLFWSNYILFPFEFLENDTSSILFICLMWSLISITLLQNPIKMDKNFFRKKHLRGN